ncbi:prephenate dehydrogenase/arogenate dehydrogenase family protein [Immundisolibacter sp.]|uniref:prephenate dehydrogenase n=1 Tax=Immundisolibacter sp. TaxID=1934948 RepID=UPI002616898A|nr:prephenate dehydrogenase/arogenate dehydrogenase family protein [Immundisolibacter sp.]MDD3650596.1 prephenate dehydrogenase/arogenate dehydrogenase family protein [Immundisolibacter sp.]
MANIVVIGLGLIGGSLARDLRRLGHRVTACGRDAAKLAPAVELGIVDAVADDWAAALAAAEVVVLGVPVGSLRELYARIRPLLPATAVVTDVGSTKGSVVRDVADACGGRLPARFVPGHPIAGTEHSGFSASVEGLFAGRTVVLTPTADTDPAATARVAALWQQVGARVLQLTPDQHDAALALTSHLPQMLAYTLMGQFAEADDGRLDALIGSGFRSMTRLAGSDPLLWRDVALANRAQLSLALHRYLERLGELTAAVDAGDAAYLEALFASAQAAQRRLPP